MRVCIHTFGCRTNLSDSSNLARSLTEAGFTLVKDDEMADVVVVNSCTVTAGADRDVRHALRRARRAGPAAHLVLAGCLPVAYPGHEATRLADTVMAGNDWQSVVGLLKSSCNPDISRPDSLLARHFPLENLLNLSRANIKIGQGCDQGCAYCIVPSARGKPESRPLAEITENISLAKQAGFSEVVLTATHVARYGDDRPGQAGLEQLLDAVQETAGDCRVRLSSLEPDERLFVVLDHMSRTTSWCRHIHVALQHASDDILRRMGRPYRLEEAARFVRRAHEMVPGIGIGMDVIVGYPGETEEDFEILRSALESLPFTYLHVFAYSPRPGTRAATGKPVPPPVVKARSLTLRTLAGRRKAAFARRLVGTEIGVLVEKRREPRLGRLMGLTDNYVRVYMDGIDGWMGNLVPAVVTSVERGVLVCDARLHGG